MIKRGLCFWKSWGDGLWGRSKEKARVLDFYLCLYGWREFGHGVKHPKCLKGFLSKYVDKVPESRRGLTVPVKCTSFQMLLEFHLWLTSKS